MQNLIPKAYLRFFNVALVFFCFLLHQQLNDSITRKSAPSNFSFFPAFLRVSFNHSCGPREEERLRGIDVAYSGLISTEVGQEDRPCRCQDRSEQATGHSPPLLPGNSCSTLTSRQRPRALRIPEGGSFFKVSQLVKT